MFGWIVFGLLVGALAAILLPGRSPGGVLVPMLLGLAGGVLGGSLGRLFGWYGEADPLGSIVAAAGAIILLVSHRVLTEPSPA